MKLNLLFFFFFWALTGVFAILSTEYLHFIGLTILCGVGSIILNSDLKKEY
jgi:hypothetical protein